ncbi:hypothetical protein [Halorhabdus amylolytica]|uniref:hypothetical protein n=1 Tax=Halorhabdus amylolytica TaxID=2559573 RepID=UPI00145A6370|nr:hypothetical protein [Halorhabdus amylolytica]
MRVLFLGVVTTGFGLCGYAVGTLLAYPGRAFSLTAMMVGLTLVVIGRGSWGGPT